MTGRHAAVGNVRRQRRPAALPEPDVRRLVPQESQPSRYALSRRRGAFTMLRRLDCVGQRQLPTNGVFLARGKIAAAKLPGLPGYAMLELSQVWSPGSGAATEPDVVYRVRDNGVRCITAPCFSFDARLVGRAPTTRLSDVDLSSARLTPKQQRRATSSLTTGRASRHGTNRRRTQGRPRRNRARARGFGGLARSPVSTQPRSG